MSAVLEVPEHELEMARALDAAIREAIDNSYTHGNGFVRIAYKGEIEKGKIVFEVESLDPETVVIRNINPVLTAPEIHDERSPR